MVYLCVAEDDVGIIVLVLWTALTIIVTADLLRFRFKGVARQPYENLPSTRVLDARERAG
jgi:diacylglycerol kinase (CTP)